MTPTESRLDEADVAAGESPIYLPPGQIFFATEEAVVVTILGSCVAVCLFDSERRLGGLNHYLLPDGPGNSPRYAAAANDMLLEKFRAVGCGSFRLKAKLFGAAATGAAHIRDLPSRNIAAAEEFLRIHEIPIVEKRVGGKRGMKLVFRTGDGRTWVKFL